jgi:FAD:protein FMN transferase
VLKTTTSCLTTSVVDLKFFVLTQTRARKRTSFLFFGLLIFLLSACSQEPAEHYRLSGSTMGTSYHITLVGSVQDLVQLQAEVDRVLQAVNQQMSTYIADSELMQLNRAPLGQSVNVSKQLAFLLAESRKLHQASNGAFDVTVGPLVNRWGFGPDEEQTAPTVAEIQALLQRVGFENLKFGEAGRQVSRERDVFVDLSAIAKGYGVDQVAELLRSLGYQNYLVEIGGELRLSGHNPDGRKWNIAIERPELAPGSVQAAIAITDRAVATSGSYRNFKMVDGRRLSHTIDPTTGWPVEHDLVSVTVIAETCAQADGLATAFSVMGPEQTLEYASANAIPVFLLELRGDKIIERWSTAFEPYLKL